MTFTNSPKFFNNNTSGTQWITGSNLDIFSTQGTTVISLGTTGIVAGTYGDTTNVAQIAVDSHGRIVGVMNVPVAGGSGAGTGILSINNLQTVSQFIVGSGIDVNSLGSSHTLSVYTIGGSNASVVTNNGTHTISALDQIKYINDQSGGTQYLVGTNGLLINSVSGTHYFNGQDFLNLLGTTATLSNLGTLASLSNLGTLVTTTTFTSDLGTKADLANLGTLVNTANLGTLAALSNLGTLVDITTFTNDLGTKADTIFVSNSLGTKLDSALGTAWLSTKADLVNLGTLVNTSNLGTLAGTAYVNSLIGTTITTINTQGQQAQFIVGSNLIVSSITGTHNIALGTTGVTGGTYGNATNTPQIVVDGLGRILAASNVAISGGGTAVSTRNGIRQAVISGTSDSDNNPRYLYTGTGLAPEIVASAPSPFTITLAQGVNASGELDSTYQYTTNQVFPAVPANTTNYLYVDYTAGTQTLGSTIVPDQYGQVFDRNEHALLHFEGANTSTSIIDAYGNNWYPSGTAQVSTGSSMFGTSSLKLGNSSYIQCPEIIKYGNVSGDFTLEGWVNFSTLPASAARSTFWCGFNDTNFGFATQLLNTTGTHTLRQYLSSNGSTWDIASDTNAVIPTIGTNTWNHIALTQDRNATYRLYWNGTQALSVASTLNIYNPAKLRVGAGYDATTSIPGYMDEIRYTNNCCRYPNGTTFTPSATAFTEDVYWFDKYNHIMKYGGPTTGWTNKTLGFVGKVISGASTIASVFPKAINNIYPALEAYKNEGFMPEFKCRAWVNFDGTVSANVSGQYSQSGTTVTVTLPNHRHKVGHVIYADITSGTGVDGVYTIASIVDSNTFTYTAGTSLTTSGNVTFNRRAIRASGNIHSVIYNAFGDYSINFSTLMPDAGYSAFVTPRLRAANGALIACALDGTVMPTNAYVRIRAFNFGSTFEDTLVNSVSIFR